MPVAALIGYRLGHIDGVSVEADKWASSLRRLGWDVITVAGAGTADIVLPGLAIDASADAAISPCDVEAALRGVDVVIAENICSLPMNPRASRAVAGALKGRAAILHHHDLPWQRERFRDAGDDVPDDAAWQHVTINDLSRHELAERGIAATTIRNVFDTSIRVHVGDRSGTRASLGVADGEWLVVQPTRAIARKDIPKAVSLAEELGATYWLLGPAEEGYAEVLAGLLAGRRVRGIHGTGGTRAGDAVVHAYAAADLVVFPSTWEGFGNPVIESALWERPLAIARYPVADEFAQFDLRWLDVADPIAVQRWLEQPDEGWLQHNRAVAERWFSLDALDAALEALLRSW